MTTGLQDLKVVDFTWNITGPLAVKALSDYGAEVIRIEGRRRLQKPMKDDIAGVNRSDLFNQRRTRDSAAWRRGKRTRKSWTGC